VNVGCVPKKVMFATSSIAETLHQAKEYGFDVTVNSFNWKQIKESRDAYIVRLNKIYESNLAKEQIPWISGTASFLDKNTVLVNNEKYTAKKILIATGLSIFSFPFFFQFIFIMMDLSSLLVLSTFFFVLCSFFFFASQVPLPPPTSSLARQSTPSPVMASLS